jgi:SAM-dependent methyltransferase
LDATPRRVTPELLDDLDPSDPRARRSRRDLRRVHRAMGSVRILRGMIRALHVTSPPRSIIELGAGDGTLLLRLARVLGDGWSGVNLTLLDRHDLIADATRAAYREMGWTVTVLCQDALAWSRPPVREHYDLCVVNLFLHHFLEADLASLLRGSAERSDAFIACEPRRDTWSRLGSRVIGLLGANSVTREDAVKSVDAGFSGKDLSALWAAPGDWITAEYPALPFTHCFAATRRTARTEPRHDV